MPSDPPTTMDGDPLDMSRRDFMLAGTTSLMAMDGVGQLQLSGSEPVDEYEFQGVADLMGPADARPQPGSEFFDNKVFWAYRYREANTGLDWFITQDDSEWSAIPVGLHQYATADLPTGTQAGELNFDSDRGTPAWWDRDHYEFPTFVDDVETSDDEVSNTTTETEILRFGTNPGALRVGRVFILRNFGVYSTAASTDDFTYRIYVGEMGFDPTAGSGTLLGALTTVQENVTDGPWQAKTTLIVESEGASGEADTHTEARFNDTPNDDHNRNVTLDTTTAEEFVATIQWNNAKADNVARQDMSYLQQQG